ncbi:hypothetical protein SISNIDRAFT_485475 [Sistotremastrum niveocremeum HHB9708]|uniref:Uncharacterized protein n=1 Tax=Sistotremastrum niveocremeum HHB9708 TaxID=1314777 RepID=A0A164V779_9AGAM|nr:hypothetical protein SISNIDRAFT_485475 [Sistotremastrum niveocremeum HHB9708]
MSSNQDRPPPAEHVQFSHPSSPLVPSISISSVSPLPIFVKLAPSSFPLVSSLLKTELAAMSPVIPSPLPQSRSSSGFSTSLIIYPLACIGLIFLSLRLRSMYYTVTHVVSRLRSMVEPVEPADPDKPEVIVSPHKFHNLVTGDGFLVITL